MSKLIDHGEAVIDQPRHDATQELLTALATLGQRLHELQETLFEKSPAAAADAGLTALREASRDHCRALHLRAWEHSTDGGRTELPTAHGR